MTYLIALSGGLDSMVLLHLFQQQYEPGFLRAVHVHHGLSPNADAWSAHCAAWCAQWQIPLEICRITLAKKSGESLEALARDARYDLFATLLKPGETLVTAHHQNDQAETFLLHALRGSGPRGLAAMPAYKKISEGMHWRPLLNLNREALFQYARAHEISWVEDESNADVVFDRNFLRHHILPKLKERWPKVIENFARVSEIQAELSDYLDQLLAPAWSAFAHHRAQLKIHPLYQSENLLPLSLLEELAPALQNWLLREWIRKATHQHLSKKQLRLILQTVIHAKKTSNRPLKSVSLSSDVMSMLCGSIRLCRKPKKTEEHKSAFSG